MLKLRDDQIGDLAFAIANPKSMNLSDPGTGKTPTVAVNQWRRASEGRRTIWSQPKHLMKKNVRELLRFTPFTAKDVAIVDGTKGQIDKAMNSGAQVLLMGPDRFKKIHRDLPDGMAHDVDEFHMAFGGAGTNSDGFGGSIPSARVSAFYEFNRRSPEGVFMTGTLINGRLDTAFPAIHAIEPNYYPFGYDQFLGAHAYLDERGKPFAWHSHDRIGAILGRHAVRHTFDSIYGKQAVVFETEWLSMNDAQRKVYDQFSEQAFYELELFMIDGTLPGVATIRARQIMEHPNYFRDLRDPYNLPHVDITPGVRPAKLDAMEVHFDHHNRMATPVIVFAALIPQQQQLFELARKMGRRVGMVDGAATTREKDEVDEGFVAGRYDTVIASPPVAVVGYNWQFCGEQEVGHVINASLTYKDVDFSQGYKRAIRGKRSSPLRVTTQAYLDSVDPAVMAIQVRKSRDAHLVDNTQDIITFSSHEEVLDQ